MVGDGIFGARLNRHPTEICDRRGELIPRGKRSVTRKGNDLSSSWISCEV